MRQYSAPGCGIFLYLPEPKNKDVPYETTAYFDCPGKRASIGD